MGTGCEEFRGGWDGDKLTMHSPGGMMGQMRMCYEFCADDKLNSSMECSQDGKNWTKMFDAVYTISS
jgi:hypothetical protein